MPEKYRVTVTAQFTIVGNIDSTEAAKIAADKIRALKAPATLVTDIHVHRCEADVPSVYEDGGGERWKPMTTGDTGKEWTLPGAPSEGEILDGARYPRADRNRFAGHPGS